MGDPAGSVYALMASWFTPSSLFIFVNLVIGTIAITSRFGAPRRQFHESELAQGNSPQLVRSPSLLERVRSFNLGLYKHEPTFAETEFVQPQLVRTPSLLERVKSFNFGLYQYEPTPAETEYARPDQPEDENSIPNPDNQLQPQLTRAPSLLERLKSVSLSHLYRSDSIHAEKESEKEEPGLNPGHDSGKGRGDLTETSKSESAAGMPERQKMRKSASEKSGPRKSEEDGGSVEPRRPATARSETASLRGDEEVDAKADDFINRFKKQLRLQRVDSILRSRGMVKGN